MGGYIEKDWNNIYKLNRINSSVYCKQNQQIYNSIVQEQYKTLDDCVKYAITMGNHTAFVHYFIEKAKSQKDIFLSVLWKYIDEYDEKRKQDKKLPSWGKFKIFESSYWRTYNFECMTYEKEVLKKYVYSESLLSMWKNSAKNNIPNRDAIVQCCLYLGKNVEETNYLLVAAGRSTLYELDIVDAVSMYYLEKYHEDFTVEGYEKIREVKSKINIGLEKSLTKDMLKVRGFKQTKVDKKTLTEEEKEVMKELGAVWQGSKLSFEKIIYEEPNESKLNVSEDIQKKYGVRFYKTYSVKDNDKYYENLHIQKENKYAGNYLKWDSKSKYIYRFEKKEVIEIGAKSAVGLKIDEEIKNYRNILDQNTENKVQAVDTDYLTFLYQKKLKDIEKEKVVGVEKCIETYIESGQIDSENWIFVQKRYGYLKKTLQFLKEYSYYIKNLQYSLCDLTTRNRGVSINDLRQRGKFIDKQAKKFIKEIKDIFLENVNGEWKVSDIAESQKGKVPGILLKNVNGIWKIANEVEDEKENKKKEPVKDIFLENVNGIWKVSNIREDEKEKVSGILLKYINGKWEISDTTKDTILLKIINKIWEISDAIEENGNLQFKTIGIFKARTLIEGRNILDGEAYQIETKENDSKNENKAYVMDLTDKIFSMKYAIATGREDEMGKYLKYAGFWDKDLSALECIEEAACPIRKQPVSCAA